MYIHEIMKNCAHFTRKGEPFCQHITTAKQYQTVDIFEGAKCNTPTQLNNKKVTLVRTSWSVL